MVVGLNNTTWNKEPQHQLFHFGISPRFGLGIKNDKLLLPRKNKNMDLWTPLTPPPPLNTHKIKYEGIGNAWEPF